MKRTLQLFILIILVVLLLTSCGGNSPSRTAKDWFGAIATSDGTTALALTCEVYKADV